MNRIDWLKLLAVLGVALIVKITLLTSQPVIARDGIHFVHFAQQLENNSWKEVIRSQPYHPLYPLAILGMHQATANEDSPLSWHRSALLVSLLAGLIMLVPLYFLAREYIGSDAWLVPLLFTLLPAPCQIMSDSLAEAMLLLGETSSILALILGLKTGRYRWFALAGLTAGLGYLTRPEAVFIPILGCIALWLGQGKWPESVTPFWNPKKRLFASVTLLSLLLLLVTPYAILIGKFSARPSTAQLLQVSMADERTEDQTLGVETLLASRIHSDSLVQSTLSFLAELSKASSYLVWLALLPLWTLIRQSSGGTQVKQFLILLVTVNTMMLIWLSHRAHYLSERHCLLLVSMSLIALIYGLRRVCNWLSTRTTIPHAVHSAPLIFVAIVGLVSLSTSLRPLHHKQQPHQILGSELAKTLQNTDIFVDPIGFARFYAGLPPVEGDWVNGVTSETSRLFMLVDIQEDDPHRLHQFERALKNHPHEAVLNWPATSPRYIIYQRMLKE